MFHTYILKSKKDNRYYIGHTKDIQSRLEKHNSGKVTSTKHRGPFEIIHYEKFDNKNDAYKRELEIKRMKGGIQSKL